MTSPPKKTRTSKPFVRQVIRSRSSRKSAWPDVSPNGSHRENAGILALVRHGESEFNKQDRFTGLKNPDLTRRGIQEAINVGRCFSAFQFDVAFTSKLKRAQQSLRLILAELDDPLPSVFEEALLNERDYGDLSGLTREAARARWGEARVALWSRSFDVAPPGGESLQMTANRTIPFFEVHVRPLLARGQNVLIVAHRNSLRSIVMSLDGLTSKQIVTISFATGAILMYRFTSAGTIAKRTEILVKG